MWGKKQELCNCKNRRITYLCPREHGQRFGKGLSCFQCITLRNAINHAAGHTLNGLAQLSVKKMRCIPFVYRQQVVKQLYYSSFFGFEL